MGGLHKTSDVLRLGLQLDVGQLDVRSIGPADKDRVAALFTRLSPQSRYRRFLSPKRELTSRELRLLTDVDHVGHEALAVIDRHNGEIVAVARYARDPARPGTAHIAVAVEDRLHGRGIGTALTRLVVERARVTGHTRLLATTLWENQPSRSLLRRLGFRALGSEGSVIELGLELRSVENAGLRALPGAAGR
jgi:RimJ/RimL family protein N-acetyltransferase